MANFRKLNVWSRSKALAVKIYKLTEGPTFSRDFRLKDQIRAAAISIASNIAEGDELQTNKQSIRHFYIAKGSCAELMTQLIIAKEIGYIDSKLENEFVTEVNKISLMLFRLIKARMS